MFTEVLKKKPAASQPTIPLAVWTTRATIEELLSLYDGWRALLPYDVPDQLTRLRQKHDGDEAVDDADERLHVGASIPAWLVNDIEQHAARYDRTRSYILSKCLEAGVPKLTLENLMAVYKDLKPTMSLIVVAALKIGFKDWEKRYGIIKYPGKLHGNSAERSFPTAAAADA